MFYAFGLGFPLVMRQSNLRASSEAQRYKILISCMQRK